MSVLSRDALESSPLADLHTIASELGIDGFRRLRKAQLIDAILGTPEGEGDGVAEEIVDEAAAEPEARPRRRRGGRGRSRDADAEVDADANAAAAPADADAAPPPPARRGRGRSRDAEAAAEPEEERGERVAEGVVELLGNGAGFLRVGEGANGNGDAGEDDVYISAAQIRRCELVSGDRVSGPVRRPRRSERYSSLIRVDTINGAPADEVAEGTPFEELPCAFPTERLALASEDPTLKAIEWLTPIGRGSRVTVVGGPRAGKTEALRRLAGALAAVEGLELTVVLAGVRPEEMGEWRAAGVEPAATLGLAAGADVQAQAIERAIELGRRVAARGGHAAVLVDTLDGAPPAAARRALAAARNIVDGGSLTVVATAARPLGGETTVVALDAALTAAGRFPALDLAASGTLRPELLVGEAGAEAIAQARAGA
jgi:transcription termination factor Rho